MNAVGQVTAALAQRDASRRTELIGTAAAGVEQAYHSAAEPDLDSALTSVVKRVVRDVDPASIIALPEDSYTGWLSFGAAT